MELLQDIRGSYATSRNPYLLTLALFLKRLCVTKMRVPCLTLVKLLFFELLVSKEIIMKTCPCNKQRLSELKK